ncbi:MAG: glycosyltransferase family A protein [Pseudomonadota bacterium]
MIGSDRISRQHAIGPDLVSVVVPTFDRAHLLQDALNSVRAQSWRPLEVIVVDDGSTDDTRAVFENWASRNDTALTARIETQDHKGGNAARNLGVATARGTHVAFLDSDDLWKPEKIALQMRALETSPGSGAAYCGIEEVEIGSDEAPYCPDRPYPDGDLFRLLLVSDVTAPTSCFVISKPVLDAAGGFDEDLRARQDWDLWIRVARETKIAAVPEPLVVLRSHAGPRTISDPHRELRAHRAILEKYAADRQAAGWRVERASMAAYHRRAGRVHFHHVGNKRAAFGHYLRAILWSPLTPDNYFALTGALLPAESRRRLHRTWNSVFGRTAFRIKSH